MNCKKCDSDLEFKLQEGKERDGLSVICPVCGQIARYRLREYQWDCYPPRGYEKPQAEGNSESGQMKFDIVKKEKPEEKPKKKPAKIKTTPEKLERVEKSKETIL